jgi:hypothetical protein
VSKSLSGQGIKLLGFPSEGIRHSVLRRLCHNCFSSSSRRLFSSPSFRPSQTESQLFFLIIPALPVFVIPASSNSSLRPPRIRHSGLVKFVIPASEPESILFAFDNLHFWSCPVDPRVLEPTIFHAPLVYAPNKKTGFRLGGRNDGRDVDSGSEAGMTAGM